jgi:hypothetical protein
MRPISILAIASTLCISSAALAAAPSTSPRAGGMSGMHATQPGTAQTQKNTAATTAAPSTTTTTTRGPSQTGQPNQSCEDLGNQPGNSMSAPGSAFNPNGTAGGMYAGNQPQSSRNTASVSQYDVACARPSK